MCTPRAGYYVTLYTLLVFAFVQAASCLAVSKVYHIQFCNGERMSVGCPDDWQIHVTSGYFVYVHGVRQAGATCRQHLNSTKQCLRKIQFYDPDYYRLIIKSCQSKQRCDDGLVARIGDPKVCWDYPRSPSDYLTFSYVCVNVHIDQSTTAYVGTTTSAHKPRGSSKPSGITGTTDWANHISYPTTTWPGLIRTTSYRRWPVATSRVGQLTRILLYTSTMSALPHRTTSYPYTHSTTERRQPRTTVGRNVQPKTPIAASKTEAKTQSQKFMVVFIPIIVVAMIAAVVIIAAVIACRNPEKKSPLKRKLSQNSSVYYNNADRHSLGGDSVQTRASIHGITNLGYDVTDKPFADAAYVDHVILNAHEPEVTQKPDPGFAAREVTSDPELVEGVPASEPLAEQTYAEFNQVGSTCNYI